MLQAVIQEKYKFQQNQETIFSLKRDQEDPTKRNTGLIVEFDVKRPTA